MGFQNIHDQRIILTRAAELYTDFYATTLYQMRNKSYARQLFLLYYDQLLLI